MVSRTTVVVAAGLGVAAVAAGVAVALAYGSGGQGGGQATGLSLGSNPNPAQVNQSVTLTGRLTRTDTGAGLPGLQVTFETSTNQVNWSPINGVNATTDANGNFTAAVVFTSQGLYYIRASFAGA